MRTQSCTWNGTTATLNHHDEGENIARHQHDVEHTTIVISGPCKIWEDGGFGPLTNRPEYGPKTLAKNRDHEITAVEDGTIVLNMIAESPPKKAADGGIQMHETPDEAA